jgi:hypothetical protein
MVSLCSGYKRSLRICNEELNNIHLPKENSVQSQCSVMLTGTAHSPAATGLFMGTDAGCRAVGESGSRRGSECSRSGESACSNLNQQLGTQLIRRGSSCSRIGCECSSLGDIAEDEIRIVHEGTVLRAATCCVPRLANRASGSLGRQYGV